jgi:hypothetical protein
MGVSGSGGIAFTFLYAWAFDLLGIRDEAPEGAYVPLLGSFVLVLGIAYVLIYRGDLQRNRDLILVGTIYKFAYSSVATVFWLKGDAPHAIFVVFGAVDIVFFVLMFYIWRSLGKVKSAAE